MTENNLNNDAESTVETENEVFPVEPRYHPIHKIPRKIYDFFASSKLAMFLLITILVCCVSGVTIVRGLQAWQIIFSSLWFNGLLVLLIVNVACCFFGRIWHRKLTIISFGMILFHLSFVSILGGIIYNSLFYFRGSIRLTEGETISSSDPQSYDAFEKGRFFSFSRIKGETALNKMSTGFKVDGADKRVAYDVTVGEEPFKKQGLIYITHKLSHQGFDYFNDKEGYALQVSLEDKSGRYLYGVSIPLQSIRNKDQSFQYTTGFKEAGIVKPSVIPFPLDKPLFALRVGYNPSKLKERAGDFIYELTALDKQGMPKDEAPFVNGKSPIGAPFVTGEYVLTANEVRYWVAILVRYEPGKPIVLTSLWVGLAGMIITTLGRMFRKDPRGA